MKPHWNDEQFAENLIQPGTVGSSRSHANECDECRGELEQLDNAIRGLRDALHDTAGQSPFFWNAQRTAIRARVASASRPRHLRWAVASAAALAALAIAMLVPGHVPQPQVNTASTKQVHVDQDELLMRQIDESLLSNVAEPLEPANLIASDLGNAMQQSQNNSNQQ